MNRIVIKLLPWAVLPCLLTACAFKDAQTAQTAQRSLIGQSQLELEACLGAPDQRSTLGDTDILTYYVIQLATGALISVCPSSAELIWLAGDIATPLSG